LEGTQSLQKEKTMRAILGRSALEWNSTYGMV
jgi:hypothetical protein